MIQDLKLSLDTIAVYRRVAEAPVLRAFAEAYTAALSRDRNAVRLYSQFVAALLARSADCNLTRAVYDLVLTDLNAFSLASARCESVSPGVAAATRHDLGVLARVASVSSREFKRLIADGLAMPELSAELADYATGTSDLTPEYCAEYHKRHGAGIYAKYDAFVYGADGNVSPVANLDPIRLRDLKNYANQRDRIVNNTLALLSGLPYHNALLYGDRGTGKSSTVKALLNEYAPRGLRLVELPKSNLPAIDALIRELAALPNRFIIFIDDLSFNEGDAAFGLLKAALEGSVAARPDNVAIYATSNRRHLVKETFSAREGNEVHRADTLDETMSLSERFGLTVTFLRPGRDEYLDIVHQIAADYNINIPETELDLGAEQWATRCAGRSPRIAKQYVMNLLSAPKNN